MGGQKRLRPCEDKSRGLRRGRDSFIDGVSFIEAAQSDFEFVTNGIVVCRS